MIGRMSAEKREAIRKRLAELERAGGGRLTPDAVVADARNPDSVLHDQFDWDDETAAERFRVEQARELITSIIVVKKVEDRNVMVVNYVRDPSAAGKEQGYISIGSVRRTPEHSREVLLYELSRVKAGLVRASSIANALDVESDIDEVVDRVDVLIARL
jgi:hypothetical protein